MRILLASLLAVTFVTPVFADDAPKQGERR